MCDGLCDGHDDRSAASRGVVDRLMDIKAGAPHDGQNDGDRLTRCYVEGARVSICAQGCSPTRAGWVGVRRLWPCGRVIFFSTFPALGRANAVARATRQRGRRRFCAAAGAALGRRGCW